jgi:hypothetical protein
MKYRITHDIGNRIDLKTKTQSGILTFDSDCMKISGAKPMTITNWALKGVELFRLHGPGRMIKMAYADSTVFLTVVRLNLFGYFLLSNFLKTGALCEHLRSECHHSKRS